MTAIPNLVAAVLATGLLLSTSVQAQPSRPNALRRRSRRRI